MAVVSLCSDCKALKFLKNLHGNNEQECLCFTQLKQESQELLIEQKVLNDKHSTRARKCSAYSSDHNIRTINRYDVLSEIQTQSDEIQDKIPVVINNK